jgi:hypothetical protein
LTILTGNWTRIPRANTASKTFRSEAGNTLAY